MVFKILPRDTVVLANLKDPAVEAELRKVDWQNKGFLTKDEAYNYYAQKNQNLQPANLEEVVKFLGGEQHPVNLRFTQQYDMFNFMANFGEWRGDFNTPGLGAGNVHTGRRSVWVDGPPPNQADVYDIHLNANLIDKAKLEQNVVSGALVIGPKGLPAEAQARGNGEVIELPLTLATQDAYTSYSRGGAPTFVQEKKGLAVSLDTAGLRDLAGNSGGLEFFYRLTMNDGSTKFVNLDGVPGKNFQIPSSDLAERGTP